LHIVHFTQAYFGCFSSTGESEQSLGQVKMLVNRWEKSEN